MAQLLFEPSATKIGEDDWLVVPKNNEDSIDVNDNDEAEADIRTGTGKFCMRCSTIIKDIILAMWGEPEEVNGVLKGHAHSEEIIDKITEMYQDIWLPEDNDKFSLTVGEEEAEYDTLSEAVGALVGYVKHTLQRPESGEAESEGGDDDDSTGN